MLPSGPRMDAMDMRTPRLPRSFGQGPCRMVPLLAYDAGRHRVALLDRVLRLADRLPDGQGGGDVHDDDLAEVLRGRLGAEHVELVPLLQARVAADADRHEAARLIDRRDLPLDVR